MTLLSTRAPRLTEVVQYELAAEHGYSREIVTATLSPTSQIGDVLADPGTGGAWDLVAVATTGNDLGVLVQPDIEELRPATGTVEVEVAVLVRTSIVIDKSLTYGADVDTAAEIADVNAQLKSQGVVVGKGV